MSENRFVEVQPSTDEERYDSIEHACRVSRMMAHGWMPMIPVSATQQSSVNGAARGAAAVSPCWGTALKLAAVVGFEPAHPAWAQLNRGLRQCFSN